MTENSPSAADVQAADPNYDRYVALVDQFVKVAVTKLGGDGYPHAVTRLGEVGSVAAERNARIVERAGFALQDAIDRRDVVAQRGSMVDMIAGQLARMGEHAYDGYPVSDAELTEAEEGLREVKGAW